MLLLVFIKSFSYAMISLAIQAMGEGQMTARERILAIRLLAKAEQYPDYLHKLVVLTRDSCLPGKEKTGNCHDIQIATHSCCDHGAGAYGSD